MLNISNLYKKHMYMQYGQGTTCFSIFVTSAGRTRWELLAVFQYIKYNPWNKSGWVGVASCMWRHDSVDAAIWIIPNSRSHPNCLLLEMNQKSLLSCAKLHFPYLLTLCPLEAMCVILSIETSRSKTCMCQNVCRWPSTKLSCQQVI
jgi:hypothetical protein